ncbi:hypothetical protein KI688_006547 [Linnemannia hyalina]|uniref:C2H2-type domain-containing protein n=1 Tax=Linnemannia hyalina TaxID=64524 RepID=A0A9P8BNG7_9FUNG|nr:hypothetical protein KI688_006547 [Linnemannia hyalina]
MQVHPSAPNHYYTTSTTQQHPYNPNMFASTTSSQYTLLDHQQQQQQQQQQPNEDMFLQLERLLMGISPFPPTMPTLAKPTCPSLDDQLMAEMSSPSSTIPSIVLNEQSLDMLQQFYQNQDNQHNNQQYSQSHEQSDCSSTSRSGSPPASPYSYASSMVSSPAMPILDYNNPYASMVAQQHHHHQQQQFEQQMSMPLNLPSIEAYMAPSAALLSHSHSRHCQHAQSLSSVMPTTTTYKKSKTHHRRSSSSASSAISAYESAARGYRASSISSICSATSTNSTIDGSAPTATTTKAVRPVKSYACPTCTKPFPTRTQLKSHMAIHTDLFPFPCQYAGCELHFKRKHDLRRHVDAKHALVKKYLCTGGCGEGFGRRDQMVRHLRRGTCGKGFQTE